MPLFKKDIDPMCVYCAHSSSVSDTEVLCKKKGIQSPTSSCKRFRYDPLRRQPPRPKKVDFSSFSPEDFKL